MSGFNKDERAVSAPHSSTLPVFPAQQDELDLLELLSLLLDRKKTILGITFAAMVIGAGVSYMLPQRWTSSAVIVPPEIQQMRMMEKTLNELTVLDIKTDITPDSLLSDYMRYFDSRDLREKYLVNTTYFKELVKDKELDATQRYQRVDGILTGNILSHSSAQDKDTDKKEYRYYELSYSAETPVAARDLLQGYINYVTDVVEEELHQKLTYQVDQVKNRVTGLYDLDLQRAENAHNIKIERLTYALQIANSAGLKKPSWSNGTAIVDDPDFSVTLGADGLSRKLAIEKSIDDVSTLNADLQNRKLYIDKLNALEIDKMQITPFKYMREPFQPIKKDKPKRVLVVLLAGIAGLLGACGYVLISSMMHERKRQRTE